jgi:nucleoside 2-deoxyribosyltransferase
MKIYLANALFSEADFEYNELLYKQMTDLNIEVYAPQKNTSINDKSKSADSVAIFDGDTEKLNWADAIVAVLDGPVIDPGVAAEIGYMAAKGKMILGLFTDSREPSKTVNEGKIRALSNALESQFAYANLYVVGAIKKYGRLFTSRKELIEHLAGLTAADPIVAEVKVYFDNTYDEDDTYSKTIKISRSLWDWYMGESGAAPKWEVLSLLDLEGFKKNLDAGKEYLMEKLSTEMHEDLKKEYLESKKIG